MIRVNLLPHREAARKARRQQFYALLGLVVLVAGFIWFVGFTAITGYISSQEDKNVFLKGQIANLDKQIKEINSLEEETNALLARKRVIDLLEANRAETVHLFNELAIRVPDGVFIRKITQTEQKINLTGYAVANARVSALMRSLDESPLLEKPELVEIRAEITGNRRLNAFNMNVQIKRQVAGDANKVAAKPAEPNKPLVVSDADKVKDKPIEPNKSPVPGDAGKAPAKPAEANKDNKP